MSKPTQQLQAYWTAATRNPKRRALPISGQAQPDEFAPDANTLVIEGGASRRRFMSLLGASSALAGLTNTGCIRKPLENIMPFSVRPEDRVPGVSLYFATAYQIGATVQGLLVESMDGRPIKIEGNPKHPGSQGATDGYAQASVLNLYDPDRSKAPQSKVVAAIVGGDPQNRKERAVTQLADEAYDRTLKATRSLDAARAAKARAQSLGQKATPSEISTTKGKAMQLRITSPSPVPMSWDAAWSLFDDVAGRVASSKGDKTAILVPPSCSPTFRYLLGQLQAQLPQAKFFVEDAGPGMAAQTAVRTLAGPKASARYSLENAELIFAADCDFLSTEPDHTRLSMEWARKRKATTPDTPMSRLYTAEAQMTVTAGAADHRQQLRSSQVPQVLMALARELIDTHKRPVPADAQALASAIKAPKLSPDITKFVKAMAKDMAARPDKSVVMVGQRQHAGAHALGMLINSLLGSMGDARTGLLRLRDGNSQLAGPGLAQLARAIDQNGIETLICLGTNPAYTAPVSLGMEKLLPKVKHLVHTGLYVDETGRMAGLHIPISQYLEAWGDLEASDGTRTICQPLIAPLYDTPSVIEVLGRMLKPGAPAKGYDLVKNFWAIEAGAADKVERNWTRWLNAGLINDVPRKGDGAVTPNWENTLALVRALPTPQEEGFEVNFHVGTNMHVGEFANNAWMQECPRTMSKLVWDNAALISQATAEKLRVKNGDMLAVKVGDRNMSIPAWIGYGQAEGTVSITMGTGRDIGEVAKGAGFNANQLRSHEAPFFEAGEVSRGSGKYELVTTQDYGLLDPDGAKGRGFANYPERHIYRETTTSGYRKNPHFSKEGDLISERDRLEPLWRRPKLDAVNQWGMSIDLNLCTGCNACQLACQSENNIPVVGKKECANGREMHWIRMDRYYRGDLNNPTAVVMPMGCQHCETAPCENVCPVQATAHSPEGLNDMAYNRCVGTRYCANNCPYKVRRFNFFNYNKDIPEVLQLSKNPDVTIRFRGVIEKCSYCVQRITAGKIATHVKDQDLVKDGVVVTACQQVCPTRAITFGNLSDKTSKVVQEKASPRTYGVLSDLGVLPRTTYLARVRNPNPELA